MNFGNSVWPLCLMGLMIGLSVVGCVSAPRNVAENGQEQKESAPPAEEIPLVCPYEESMCTMIYQPVTCSLVSQGTILDSVEAGNSCEGRNSLAKSWCESKNFDSSRVLTVRCLPSQF